MTPPPPDARQNVLIPVGCNADGGIILDRDSGVSRVHASITFYQGRAVLVDHDSATGTQINGRAILPRRLFSLEDGDEIRMGATTISVALHPVA